jgi:hypothetical protein
MTLLRELTPIVAALDWVPTTSDSGEKSFPAES